MTGTVSVACKIPMGLRLRVFDMIDGSEPVMGGGSRAVKIAQQRPGYVDIAGNSVAMGEQKPLSGGYMLTHNVDADFWTQWLEQNKESRLVTEHLIFALPQNKAADAAKEKREIKSGMERLDPDNLPKLGKQKVTTANTSEE